VGDGRLGSGVCELLGFVGLVGVADGGDTWGVGCLDVGGGVADEDGSGGIGVEAVDGVGDQVRVGFEAGDVGMGAGGDAGMRSVRAWMVR